MNYYIGIDQGKTNIRVGLVNERGEMHTFSKRTYDCQGSEAMFSLIIAYIEEVLADWRTL